MKALAHVILHQLLFGVVAGHVGAVLHAGVHASDRTSHRRAVRGAHSDGRHHASPVLRPTLHPMGGRTRAMKDLGGSSHIAAWTWFVMRGHA